jgi:hypothetical protein
MKTYLAWTISAITFIILAALEPHSGLNWLIATAMTLVAILEYKEYHDRHS